MSPRPEVPRWYGETIGFRDHDTLITWTSSIQAWTVHGAFEFSNRMQTIEIYTPNRDANGPFGRAADPSPRPLQGLIRSGPVRTISPSTVRGPLCATVCRCSSWRDSVAEA
jgi:hypothetical protein